MERGKDQVDAGKECLFGALECTGQFDDVDRVVAARVNLAEQGLQLLRLGQAIAKKELKLRQAQGAIVCKQPACDNGYPKWRQRLPSQHGDQGGRHNLLCIDLAPAVPPLLLLYAYMGLLL